jgi:hypothetical protein
MVKNFLSRPFPKIFFQGETIPESAARFKPVPEANPPIEK